MGIKGYKVLNPDWTCRGFQYELGKTYKHEGEIELCKSGFHFCQMISNCFNYYKFDSHNIVVEVEALGHTASNGIKSVTDEIKIVRELTWYEVLDLCNSGQNCDGRDNSGMCNRGHGNSGSHNMGNCNSSSYNFGCGNSGGHNIGNRNTGIHNQGSGNSGDFNQGNCNSGDWNCTDYSPGFFNTKELPLYVFNKPLDMSPSDFYDLDGMLILSHNFEHSFWICSEDMTEVEKRIHPEYKITGGYLKTVDFKTGCRTMWDRLTDSEKTAVRNLPNFDPDVFEEITGIRVEF